MSNPVLVEITRGERVESIHRGSIAIADADGAIRFARGDTLSPIYPRSALKPIQALPLVETGAAGAFAVSDEEIALACGSHSGEPMHTQRIAAWLKRIGCEESELACGPQVPRHEPAWEAMVKRGEKPTRIHNNCSGKHTGFLTVAKHLRAAESGYVSVDHPVQKCVAETLRALAGVEELPWGIDGCAAPNFMLPLIGFARALAKMAGGLTPGAKRIVSAMTAHPELTGGTGRSCTALMRACEGRAAVKPGAEGVYAAIVPEHGLGIALKIDDGAARAAETVIATILSGLGIAGEGARDYVHAPILNTRGDIVGERRPSQALAQVDFAGI